MLKKRQRYTTMLESNVGKAQETSTALRYDFLCDVVDLSLISTN